MKKHKVRCMACVIIITTFVLPMVYFKILDYRILQSDLSWVGKQDDEELLDKYPIINNLYASFYSDETFQEYNLSEFSLYDTSLQAQIKDVKELFEQEVTTLLSADIIPYEYVGLEESKTYEIKFGTISISSKENGFYHLTQIFSMENGVIKEVDFTMDKQTRKIVKINVYHPNIMPYNVEEKKTLLWKFIQYLELDALDDWNYANDSYETFRARLQFYIDVQDADTNKIVNLGICPLGSYSRNYRLFS